MNCQEVMEYMQRYLDRDLDETENSALMMHLQHCPECTNVFERLQRLSHDLENLPKVVPPCSIVDSILPRLEQIDRLQAAGASFSETVTPEKSVSRDQPTVSHVSRRRRVSWGWASGVVAAGIVLGVFMFQQPDIRQNADIYLPSSNDTGATSQQKSDMLPDSEAMKLEDQYGITSTTQSGSMDDSNEAAYGMPGESLPEPSANDAVPNHFKQQVPSDQGETEVDRGSSASANPGTHPGSEGEQGVQGQRRLLPSGVIEAPQEQMDSVSVNESVQSQPAPGSDHHDSSMLHAPTKMDVPPAESENDADKELNKLKGVAIDSSTEEERQSREVSSLSDASGDSGRRSSPMGIMTSQPDVQQALPSPDGLYTAGVEDQRVVIRRTEDGQIVYSSIMQWQAGDTIVLKEWSEHRLTYEVDFGKGSKRTVIDIKEQTETTEATN